MDGVQCTEIHGVELWRFTELRASERATMRLVTRYVACKSMRGDLKPVSSASDRPEEKSGKQFSILLDGDHLPPHGSMVNETGLSRSNAQTVTSCATEMVVLLWHRQSGESERDEMGLLPGRPRSYSRRLARN